MWDVPVDSEDKHHLILDTDGNNFPYVYVTNSDIEHGSAGDGRIRKMNGTNGKVIVETFVWRPCWGGLSAADANNDGKFEIYMCDRREGYEPPPGGLGKGMQMYDADNLSLQWYYPNMTCSSHMQALLDINNDGKMESVAQIQSTNGGICVVDAMTGIPLPGKCQSGLGLSTDAPFSIYDINGDGHQEMITARYSNAKVWDLTDWKLEATLNYTVDAPLMADVVGDSTLEIILGYYDLIIYNSSFQEIGRFSRGNTTSHTLVQDIDGDGLNELVTINDFGQVKAYDTNAVSPYPRVRTNNLFYSERRMGAGVFVPVPGAPQPFILREFPVNGSEHVDSNHSIQE